MRPTQATTRIASAEPQLSAADNDATNSLPAGSLIGGLLRTRTRLEKSRHASRPRGALHQPHLIGLQALKLSLFQVPATTNNQETPRFPARAGQMQSIDQAFRSPIPRLP